MDLFGDAEPIRVAVLGSTGSIGRQALDVIQANPDRLQVVALAAGSDSEGLLTQAKRFDVSLIGIAQGSIDAPEGMTVIEGINAAAEVVERTDAQVVLNAVTGAAGLHATMATIYSGKTLALANKESLVAAGELVMAKASPGQIRPVDSEHSAMWQLLEGLPVDLVRKIVLTGSGGPFRGRDSNSLASVTVTEALAHPVWDMGPKISVDSATLMNKGLEVIEAHFLFGFTYDEIDVVIHPQGMVHAMVEMMDGATFMHSALPDMRLPIQVALCWPDRLAPPSGLRLNWATSDSLSFEAADTRTFPCLQLAYEAGRKGDTYPSALNAANEVAVKAFIEERLKFLEIPGLVERVLEEHEAVPPDLEGVLATDDWARRRANELVGAR
ncbi:MAG: 1-deoxy-D-xylulose-5-phosphate reductoisomerase [Actinomycetota bacterium]